MASIYEYTYFSRQQARLLKDVGARTVYNKLREVMQDMKNGTPMVRDAIKAKTARKSIRKAVSITSHINEALYYETAIGSEWRVFYYTSGGGAALTYHLMCIGHLENNGLKTY